MLAGTDKLAGCFFLLVLVPIPSSAAHASIHADNESAPSMYRSFDDERHKLASAPAHTQTLTSRDMQGTLCDITSCQRFWWYVSGRLDQVYVPMQKGESGADEKSTVDECFRQVQQSCADCARQETCRTSGLAKTCSDMRRQWQDSVPAHAILLPHIGACA